MSADTGTSAVGQSPPQLPVESPPPPTGRKVRPILVGALVCAVAAAAVWGGVTLFGSSSLGSQTLPLKPKPDVFDLRGTMSLIAAGAGSYGSCGGYGGYSDITAGTAVTVYSASGTVLAQGALGIGQATSSGACLFPLSAPDVPGGEKFYLVEVSHRGRIVVQAADAKAGNVALSLGH